MPYIYEDKAEGSPFTADALTVRSGRVLEEQFAQSFEENPIAAVYRWAELTKAKNTGPKLKKEQAEDILNLGGLQGQLEIDNEGISHEALKTLMSRKRVELRRAETFARARGGVAEWTARLGVALGTTLVDPTNVGLAFVPIVGQARYAAGLKGASGALGRMGVRAKYGAIEGTVGAAVVEPFIYGSRTAEQYDYDAVDSLMNATFGTVFGAALHPTIGGFGDLASSMKFRFAKEVEEPPPLPFEETPPESFDADSITDEILTFPGDSARLTLEVEPINRPAVLDETQFVKGQGPRKIEVLKNPSKDELLRWAGRDVRKLRVMITKTHDVYLWDADAAIHSMVMRALKLKDSDIPEHFMESLSDTALTPAELLAYLKGEDVALLDTALAPEELSAYLRGQKPGGATPTFKVASIDELDPEFVKTERNRIGRLANEDEKYQVGDDSTAIDYLQRALDDEEGQRFVVLNERNEIVAAASGIELGEKLTQANYIGSIQVGAGAALARKLLKRLKERGVGVSLLARPGSEAFHKRMGFRDIREGDYDKFGSDLEEASMLLDPTEHIERTRVSVGQAVLGEPIDVTPPETRGISRRTFLQGASAVAATTLMPPAPRTIPVATMLAPAVGAHPVMMAQAARKALWARAMIVRASYDGSNVLDFDHPIERAIEALSDEDAIRIARGNSDLSEAEIIDSWRGEAARVKGEFTDSADPRFNGGDQEAYIREALSEATEDFDPVQLLDSMDEVARIAGLPKKASDMFNEFSIANEREYLESLSPTRLKKELASLRKRAYATFSDQPTLVNYLKKATRQLNTATPEQYLDFYSRLQSALGNADYNQLPLMSRGMESLQTSFPLRLKQDTPQARADELPAELQNQPWVEGKAQPDPEPQLAIEQAEVTLKESPEDPAEALDEDLANAESNLKEAEKRLTPDEKELDPDIVELEEASTEAERWAKASEIATTCLTRGS
jgi:predicted N-acetyltransferase YhbS